MISTAPNLSSWPQSFEGWKTLSTREIALLHLSISTRACDWSILWAVFYCTAHLFLPFDLCPARFASTNKYINVHGRRIYTFCETYVMIRKHAVRSYFKYQESKPSTISIESRPLLCLQLVCERRSLIDNATSYTYIKRTGASKIVKRI